MSLEAEINGKGGQVCKSAKAGQIQCPLIVRPTSEDVVVGNVFGLLRFLPPHLWLAPLLSQALAPRRFRQVWYKNLRLKFWERQPKYPPELLGFREGHSEPDLILEWDNPPTTVVLEAKWLSPIASKTANSATNDQAIRGIRTLLASTGLSSPHS